MPGDSTPDHQRGRVDPVLGRGRQRERNAVDGAGDDGLGAFRGVLRDSPVFAKRGQADLLGVGVGKSHRPGERRLEEPRRVAGDHDGIEPGRRDLFGQSVGSDRGQRAQQAHGFDSRQIRGVVRHGFESSLISQRTADLADVHANPHRASPVALVFTPLRSLRHPSAVRAGGSRGELVKWVSIYGTVYHHPGARSIDFLRFVRCMTHTRLRMIDVPLRRSRPRSRTTGRGAAWVGPLPRRTL